MPRIVVYGFNSLHNYLGIGSIELDGIYVWSQTGLHAMKHISTCSDVTSVMNTVCRLRQVATSCLQHLLL